MTEEESHSGPVHWLVRIAERAGYGDTDRPDMAAGTEASEAWAEVTKNYSLSDDDLAKLVADYFRLDVAVPASRFEALSRSMAAAAPSARPPLFRLPRLMKICPVAAMPIDKGRAQRSSDLATKRASVTK